MDIFDGRVLSLVTEGLKLSKDRFKFGLKITQASDSTSVTLPLQFRGLKLDRKY